MKVTGNFEIVARRDGSIVTIINGVSNVETDDDRIVQLVEIWRYGQGKSHEEVEQWFNEQLANGKYPTILNGSGTVETAEAPAEMTGEEKVLRGLKNIIDFFKEFEFEPNYRFVNTLSHCLVKSNKSAKSYINNYFELIDSPYKNDIVAKVKSREFDTILDDLKSVAPTKRVNTRLKIYYGSQGTGKTTLAQKESDDRCVICNASMLPSDLMCDFDFKEGGEATFKKSLLRRCMENGETLVLDEINLLPYESLRFLQGLLDGKTEFTYKDEVVHIKDGFMVIGTMNLAVNGMVYGLPEPLVDRCSETRKFALDAKSLMGAIC